MMSSLLFLPQPQPDLIKGIRALHFTYLKMTGFKSFAEPEEVAIDEGLSGIVGPNGCGKSNIVEAMRWLMGETSAKSMRGGELDDVIFAGTAQRPARNFAEVTLHIDNSDKSISGYPHDDLLEVTRRLDRGKGSSYRINGKPVRGRDIQLLFADLATGARSHGIVSQGKVGALINAKPTERRGLLEEAANTKGLQHRRHEANLRLNTAERNLTRVDDVISQMEDQKASLSKQARQAARYRSIADRIRSAEAQLFHTKYLIETTEVKTAQAKDREWKRVVAEATALVNQAKTAHQTARDALPPLREKNASVMAEKQRLDLAMEQISNEEERLTRQTSEAETRLEQIHTDMEREKQLQTDASAALAQLKEDEAQLIASENDDEPQLQAAQEERVKAREAASELETALADITVRFHAAERDQTNIERQRDDLNRRLDDVATRLAALDLIALQQSQSEASQALKEAELTVAEATSKREKASGDIETLAQQSHELTAAANTAEAEERRMVSEIEALSSLLVNQDDQDNGPAVSTMITIWNGMEQALAAALSDSLTSPVGAGHDGFWRNDINGDEKSAAMATPPKNSEPLIRHMDIPPVLARALSGVGVVDDADTAAKQQADLAPGQMLTTAEGGLWRWDGYVKPAGSAASAAQRLRHEARLKELNAKMGEVQNRAKLAITKAEESKAALQLAEQSIRALREDEKLAQNTLLEATRQFEQAQAALSSANTQAASLTNSQAEMTTARDQVFTELAGLSSREEMAKQLHQCRDETEAARTRLAETMSAENSIMRAKDQRMERRREITRDLQSWQQRHDGTFNRVAELTSRQDQLMAELSELKAQPEMLIHKREQIANAIATAAASVRDAGDDLARGETVLAEAEAAHRKMEAELIQAREAMIRQEGEMAVVERALADTIERIREKLSLTPDQLPEITGITDPDDTEAAGPDRSELAALESRVERLLRERDNIGPVNLRAEMEMAEVEERMTSLSTERDDLINGIKKLRDAIQQLNREGRERLLRSFAEVNKHFGELFATLFNGGSAELVLTDDDDPLEAGLDIMASPPGKKLQSLSLLSGGEQALTALALIFAVFLTNPAPICILDEVDAPLDDRNVARFCGMIEQIARETGTRFIVVTHHRLTMAQMDRLFGVTMEQRGISQIVSVDLQTAEKYKESA
jgi:chromosome segregation protein